MGQRARAWLLFVGDGACLAGLVLLGLQAHEAAAPLTRLALNAGPLIGTWTVVGLSLRVFHFDAPLSLRAVWGRTLVTWLAAAPLALLTRALLLGSATIVVSFMLVILTLGGAALLLWRTLFVWAANRGPSSSVPSAEQRSVN
jgi:hypothetical protein